MTLTEIFDSVMQKLDENNRYYPADEVILSGINPAQRLISILKARLTRRVALTFNAESLMVDLRTEAPRLWQIKRVVLGTITGDDPSPSSNDYRPLLPATLEQLNWKRDWLLHRGNVRQYWRFGDHWLGIYKRPVVGTTITVIFDALPLPFTLADHTADASPTSELPMIQHSLIPDIAFAFLVMKEGVGETEKAEAILQQTFGQEMTKGLRRILRQLREAQTVG